MAATAIVAKCWRLWRQKVASRGNAFWKSCNRWLFSAKQERKLHNKSSADKELVAIIFWEVLLLVGASLTQRVLLTRPWLQESRDLNVTKLQKRIANAFEALPIMCSCFLRSSKTFQNGGHSWAHGGNGHYYCKMLETLATKSGQQRQCVLEILATVDSSWETKSVDCTLRVLLTKGTGCFYLLGSPASWDSCGEFPPVDEWIALLHWSRLRSDQHFMGQHDTTLTRQGWNAAFAGKPILTLLANYKLYVPWGGKEQLLDGFISFQRLAIIAIIPKACHYYKKWPAETAEALPCGILGRGGFSWAEQERKLHIKSFADTRDWLLSVSGISWFFGGASLKGSSDKALTDCKLESKVLMSPTCNNAQIFSSS